MNSTDEEENYDLNQVKKPKRSASQLFDMKDDVERKKQLNRERCRKYRMRKKLQESKKNTDELLDKKRQLSRERNKKYRMKRKLSQLNENISVEQPGDNNIDSTKRSKLVSEIVIDNCEENLEKKRKLNRERVQKYRMNKKLLQANENVLVELPGDDNVMKRPKIVSEIVSNNCKKNLEKNRELNRIKKQRYRLRKKLLESNKNVSVGLLNDGAACARNSPQENESSSSLYLKSNLNFEKKFLENPFWLCL